MLSILRGGATAATVHRDAHREPTWRARIAIACVAAAAALTTAPAVAHASSTAATAVSATQAAKSAVAVAINAGGNGFAFYRGQADAVYLRTISGSTWSAQTSIGGTIIGAPAAAITPTGVVVAARGTDSALFVKELRNGTWGAWRSVGGVLSASPAITAVSDSRIDVFARGANGALFTRAATPAGLPLTAWQSLGGQLTTGPAAVTSGSGRIDVYATGTDHAVWTRSRSGGAWSAWSSIGGRTYNAPGAAWMSLSDQRSVFARGIDNVLYEKTFGAGGTSAWRKIGGLLIDGPGAGASATGMLVAVRGTDNAVFETLFRSGSWSSFTRIWVPAAPPPPASSLLGKDWERIPTTAKVVALTFDAGSNANGLPAIDATLRSKNVRATFFLTGDFVKDFPAQANLIAAGGYTVGNHTMTHPHMTTLTDAQVAAQVQNAQRAILTTNGVDPRPLFRFPFGEVNARVLADVNRLGYVSVRWTVDTLGWEGRTAGQSVQTVINRVLASLQPGEIVLMHVGSAPDGSTLDAAALPQLINNIRARGYTFVTLNALTG